MVPRLYQLPPFISFLSKEIFEPAQARSAQIVHETPAALIAFDHLSLITGDLRELMKGYLIFPTRHLVVYSINKIRAIFRQRVLCFKG